MRSMSLLRLALRIVLVVAGVVLFALLWLGLVLVSAPYWASSRP